MSKIVAWLILIFVVLLALRIINMRNARRRGEAKATGQADTSSQPMVRCLRCGVFLPRTDARAVDGGFACADRQCAGK
jgi:hypothetical protein